MKRLYRINGLNLEHILKEKFQRKDNFIKKHIWKYDYLITKIINKSLYGGKAKHGRYKLSMLELANKFKPAQIEGKRVWAHLQILKDLEDIGVIKTHLYGSNQKTERYIKITDEFLSKGYKQVNYVVTDKMIESMEKVEEYPATSIYGKLRIITSNVQILEEEARAFIEDVYTKQIPLKPKKKGYVWDYNRTMNAGIKSLYETYVNDITTGNFNFKVDLNTSGRVFNNLTSLPRDLRKYLRIDGKKLIEIDVANSQPLLFIPLLNQYVENNITDQEALNEVSKYKELCEHGDFYNYVYDLLLKNGVEVKDKKIMKLEFFEKVFFSSEKKNWLCRKIFDKEFPTVSKAITYQKRNNYKELSIQLQKIESEIMIQNVCKNLIEDGCGSFFPLHDAIYVTEDWLDVALSYVKLAYQKKGVNPTIRI